MSKPSSGHFQNTTGTRIRILHSSRESSLNDIIKERVKDLDLREHPVKKYSSLPLKELRQKYNNRTITKTEYHEMRQQLRLASRRKQGVKRFWDEERERILSGRPTTRPWSAHQLHAIINRQTPTLNGKSIQGHHTYSVTRYPHLANRGEIIFPVTFHEHLYGWHGGNFNNSLPGIPIKHIKDF